MRGTVTSVLEYYNVPYNNLQVTKICKIKYQTLKENVKEIN
jgi:cystathionine beta-lyase family protein involved in aluminum resistance